MTFASEVDGQLIIPAHWQSAWNASYNAMTMVGCFTAGHIQDWLGRRMAFLFSIIFAVIGIALTYTANNPAHFLGGKIVTGYAIGLALTATQTYVSETAPLPIRGIALSMNTVMMVGFGC
jgi:MFS transporter, SP family, general alpha glucoside:H+ symporter